ncbi:MULTISPECIES: CidA/LrgA family protein [unclassified Acinetobacter]|uniref:CidA/LrgA family protein n=1 Tax=unclassified Acinetobacter TaxID=196816 RepID=UPI002934DB1C|nr:MULTISPECIES: CidA/LrgA family protein [unclassified Acinetobacter]WOE33258.1 CidA/LrgA family protein [Acinetobacter sp. SAAs470]WOE36961.1 CidA/LrgA family protein [Acinetobacter sp. SAAs474]
MFNLFSYLRITYLLRVCTQLALLILIWWMGSWLQQMLQLPISAGVIGLFLLLIALMTGIFKLQWIKQGSDLILAELVLFFIPCIIGLIKYKNLLFTQGIQLIIAVLVGTLCVMIVTAYTVYWGFHLEKYIKNKFVSPIEHKNTPQQHTGEAK